MMTGNEPRLGVDIGGTFTDLALECGGRIFSEKLLTTAGAPEAQGSKEKAEERYEELVEEIEELLETTKLAFHNFKETYKRK